MGKTTQDWFALLYSEKKINDFVSQSIIYEDYV